MFAKILPWTAGAVAATAAAGSVATRDTRSLWYRSLRKPSIQPPATAFPVVWTFLYADLAVSTAVALARLDADADGPDTGAARSYQRALALNLVLNASWSWVFFKAHRIGPAIAVAAGLAASSGDLVRRTLRADRRAGCALLPYAGWCGFATVLTAAIWRRNH